MHLILLKTSDNQSYLFTTKRLRESIGASELTYQASTQFVLQAVEQIGGPTLWSNNPKILRENLKAKQPPKADVEVILATTGKALLLVKDEKMARTIVSQVTERILREIPGLDICAVISDAFDWENDNIHLQIKKLHKTFEKVRSSRPYSSARFPSLPIATLCASSGLPAQRLDKDGTPLSAISQTKQKAAEDWKNRIDPLTADLNPSQLEKHLSELPWLGLVQAEANGVDQIFDDFDKRIGTTFETTAAFNRIYLNKLRLFSLALETATINALNDAIKALTKFRKKALPIIPLFLGDTGFTLICDAQATLELTRLFLRAFEQQTTHDTIIVEIAKPHRHLSACAGVTISQPHFPLHNAHTLADDLLESAKKPLVAQPYPCSAMDFHIVYNTQNIRLNEIREQLTNQNTRLTAKPYIVTAENKLPNHIDGLLTRIQAIIKKDDYGRRLFPNSQLHELREGLLMGREEANGRLNLLLTISPRLRAFLELPSKDEDVKGLFRLAADGKWETRFLDALETATFWENFHHENA
jgi:hypothetical protein